MNPTLAPTPDTTALRRWKRYSAYKYSGVEWLGDIPSHWIIRRLGDFTKLMNGFPFESDGFNSTEGVRLVRIRDLVPGCTETYYRGPNGHEALINNGDVLIGMDGDFNVAWWTGGAAVLNQRLCSLRPKDGLDKRFMYYWLSFPLKAINYLTYSTTVKHLSSSDVTKLRYAQPHLMEQSQIVAFLDRETAKIDALIAKKERLIALLQEKRTALISHAVTKGLDPNVPMKDSGVEWARHIPEHWLVQRNVLLFRDRDERGFPDLPILEVSIRSGVTERQFSDERVEQKAEDPATYKRAKQGDLVFNKMRMWQGAVGVAPIDGLVSPDYTVAKPRDGVCSRYYENLFRTSVYMTEVNRYSHGIVKDRNRLYWDQFKEMPSLFPPPDEQRRIVEHIDRVTTQINALIAKVQNGIDKLREYRTALISAAVTGKIDVREEVAGTMKK